MKVVKLWRLISIYYPCSGENEGYTLKYQRPGVRPAGPTMLVKIHEGVPGKGRNEEALVRCNSLQ